MSNSKLGPLGLEIESRIQVGLSPVFLQVVDESELHIGHAGYREGGESHFKIIIDSQSMSAYSRIEGHRKIHGLLDDLLKEKIHALSIVYK
ncbi:MAG: BolA family transcriptional regulator [Alphaproteobacteria bacterium]|nr:BolA family transcriptional regulator [Alphaproteobacteria bacterium]|tara:strand:+ start:42677 stop:42949 length:273 start_codon:yes stop_codon:yes gene_type:complete